MKQNFSTETNRERSGKFLSDPARDWTFLLTATGVLLAGIIGWNILAFGTAAQGGVIGSGDAATPSVFDPSTLTVISSIFAARALEGEKYQNGIYKFADPSQ